MTINIKHKFASAKADGPDPSLVQPSNWNDSHDMTMATGNMLGRTAAGSGTVQEVPFTADGLALLQGSKAAQKTALDLAALAFKATIDSATLIADDIISYAKLATAAIASIADIRAGTASKLMTPSAMHGSMAWVDLVDGTNVPVDHALGINRRLVILGNRTISNPTNAKVGFPLNILIRQDTTGGRVPSWGGNYDFGDYGVPTPSTGISQEDLYCFICVDASKFVFTGTRKRTD